MTPASTTTWMSGRSCRTRTSRSASTRDSTGRPSGDVDRGAPGHRHQLGERRRENGVRVPGRGPDRLVPLEPPVDERTDPGGVADGCDTADRLPGVRTN